MRLTPRLFAVVSFLVVGMLALVVAGMLDWIVGVLFLTMEFLGEFVRNVFRRRRNRRHTTTNPRRSSMVKSHAVDTHRGIIRRKGRPRRGRSRHRNAEPAIRSPSDQRLRILVPVHGDDPDLLNFAMEECRHRQAEMIVLFLRALAVTPMGPNPLPGFDEDDEARTTFDRLGSEADRAGVAQRTIYATTGNIPATIGEFARLLEANVVLVRSTRRKGFARLLSRDPTPSILEQLPESASLTIHTS